MGQGSGLKLIRLDSGSETILDILVDVDGYIDGNRHIKTNTYRWWQRR